MFVIVKQGNLQKHEDSPLKDEKKTHINPHLACASMQNRRLFSRARSKRRKVISLLFFKFCVFSRLSLCTWVPDSSPVVFVLRYARGTGARGVMGSEKANHPLLSHLALPCRARRATRRRLGTSQLGY